ncbi:MAG: metal ABC transporter permease [Spirochaetales bacterium]|nr:metal ABC transporter permease [Spirochaetales bacterium]
MLELLSYPPIYRGLILLLLTGFTFPLAGVFVLRMNLLPIRYLLMHGVLLGGALGLALRWNTALTSVAVNILMILVLNGSKKTLKTGYGHLSMFFMVFSVAAASVITSLFHVPAKDTLTLLWGSLYANSPMTVLITGALSIGLVLFSALNFRKLTVLFHDREVASSLGIAVPRFELMVMLIISLSVASAMNLMGALLLDVQLILPVVIAGLLSSGLKQTMVLSCLLGGAFSLAGFFTALLFDIPVSSGIAIPAAAVFIIIILYKQGQKT